MLSTIDCPVRGSAKGNQNSLWKMEITWASSVPSLDKANSDVDQTIGVANAATDGGSGAIVNIKFPKCIKVRVLSKNLVCATASTGTQYRVHEVTDQSASAGTAKIRFMDLDGTPSAVAPVDGSRYQLILLLE